MCSRSHAHTIILARTHRSTQSLSLLEGSESFCPLGAYTSSEKEGKGKEERELETRVERAREEEEEEGENKGREEAGNYIHSRDL